MKLVIFGLSVSSSWGNGHATIWRGLIKGLLKRGHTVIFFERDVPYYASSRDYAGMKGMNLVLYQDWNNIVPVAKKTLKDADVAIVTSFCPDGVSATELLLLSNVKLRVFYDLDTPITLSMISEGKKLSYIGKNGLVDFDIVLSFTGGKALDELKTRLRARRAEPLYGSVDPEVHCPVTPAEAWKNDLSYLGTYAHDRQDMLYKLFIEPARKLPNSRFFIGGSQYPENFPWNENIYYLSHVPPPDHPLFYCSSTFTLNITRQAMAAMGYCPSGRLFEAAACGVPILSDCWEGLDQFFVPGSEIVIVKNAEEVIDVLSMSDAQRDAIARAARDRVLSLHTGDHRAQELETILERK